MPVKPGLPLHRKLRKVCKGNCSLRTSATNLYPIPSWFPAPLQERRNVPQGLALRHRYTSAASPNNDMRRLLHFFAAASPSSSATPTAAFGLASPGGHRYGGTLLPPTLARPSGRKQRRQIPSIRSDFGNGEGDTAEPDDEIPGLAFPRASPRGKTQALRSPTRPIRRRGLPIPRRHRGHRWPGIMIVYGGLLYLLGETAGKAQRAGLYPRRAHRRPYPLSAVAILRVVGRRASAPSADRPGG